MAGVFEATFQAESCTLHMDNFEETKVVVMARDLDTIILPKNGVPQRHI